MRPISLHGHNKPITRVKYNRDGDLLFTSAKDYSPCVWSTVDGERLGTYDGHQGAIWDLDVNFTSSLLVTAGADQCAKIWELEKGECLATISHPTPVRVVGFAHGDTMLLTVTDTSFKNRPAIHVYNLPEAGTPAAYREQVSVAYKPWMSHVVPEKITCALWGPTNDTIYFSSEDGSIVILDVETGKEVMFNTEHKAEVKRIAFDKDYTCLVSASLDHTGKLFDSRTLQCKKTYENDKPCNDCAISPLLPHVLLGGGQDAQSITNIEYNRNKFETRFYHKIFADEMAYVSGHFGPVNALAFSPDGRSFTTGGEDGFVKLYKFDDEYFKVKD